MMMSMGFMEIILLLAMGDKAGNELLDYVKTDNFWGRQTVAVSVEKMIEQVQKTKPSGEPGELPDMNRIEQADLNTLLATPGGKAIRRLMAIRALGELKDKKGLEVLHPLLESKELFVAEYAARAYAAIKGEKPKLQSVAEAVKNDPWLMPDGITGIGQMKVADSPPVDMAEILKKSPMMAMMGPGEEAKKRMEQQIDRASEMIIKLVCMIGNVRLDSVTGGLSGNLSENPDRGYGVIILRGKYDSKLIEKLIAKEQRSNTPVKEVDGVKIYSPDREVYIMMPSNETMVIVPHVGEEGNPVPVENIAKAVKSGKKALSETSEIGKLLKKIRTGGNVWGAMVMSESIRNMIEVEQLKAFDEFSLTVLLPKNDGTSIIQLTAKGDDKGKVAAGAEYVRGKIREAQKQIQKQGQEMPPQMARIQQMMLDVLNSIDIKVEGTTAVLKLSVKSGGALGGFWMMPMMMMAPGEAIPAPPDAVEVAPGN